MTQGRLTAIINLCKSLLYFYCVYNVVVKKVYVRYLIS